MPLSETERKILLDLAWASVRAAADHQPLPALPHGLSADLVEERGAFVTLSRQGRLRGCIGLIESCFSLAETVVKMAASAARNDPRFPPVKSEELEGLELEISVLSAPRQIASPEEIVLGQDGVIVRADEHSGVFLPQVATETGWDRVRFLNELCKGKAGLAEDAWRQPGCELYVFTVEMIRG